MKKRTSHFIFILAIILTKPFAVPVNAQSELPNRIQQGLVGTNNAIVTPDIRKKYGLVAVGGGCSGSMLRDNWVITAAHCLDSPDPNNAGQYITVPENSITITADWGKSPQERKSVRIISFRPRDLAIIRIESPFTGASEGYNAKVYEGSLVDVPLTSYGRGISRFAQGSGKTATPSINDGIFRMATFKTYSEDGLDGDHLAWYKSATGPMIAGGDSGGPSYVTINANDYLFGVHARCDYTCLDGRPMGTDCKNSNWTWVSSTPESADAPVKPVWDQIQQYLGAFVPPTQFIGSFTKTPADYQPMMIYVIKNNGELMWYRKDNSQTPWQGPKKVGTGWESFIDVIPAGGNCIYALSNDGKLSWNQHDGFNDGTIAWKKWVDVGRGWKFKKIFSGNDGIIYAVKEDGTLLWYKHNGYATGGGPETWSGPKVIGSGWQDFKEIFSTGSGRIYAVKTDGTLLLYEHTAYRTGELSWTTPVQVGTGWGDFRQIVPLNDGMIIGIHYDGRAMYYKHNWLLAPNQQSRIKNNWEGPTEIGNGFLNFKKVFGLFTSSVPEVIH